MKLSSLVIISALVLSILSPLNDLNPVAAADHTKYLMTLDVCNTAGCAISSVWDAPVIHECPRGSALLEFAECIEKEDMPFVSSLYYSPLERPPKS